MNINQNNDNQRNLDEAGTNTAHVAGKAAATAAGGALGGVVGANVANKAYDAVSNTKLGQGIEQGVGKVIGNTPILNQVNKKANDIGAVDTAGKIANLASGRRPRKRNLDLARRASKPNMESSKMPSKRSNGSAIPDALRNRRNKRPITPSSTETNENPTEENTDINSEEEVSETPSLMGGNSKGTLKALMKLMPVLLPIILVLAVILVLVIFLSSIVSMAFPAAGLFSDSEEYVLNDPIKKQEQDNFEQAINDIINEYRSKYGVTLDKHLLTATVIYRYLGEDDDLFSSSGNENISDEELNNRFENLGKLDEEGNVDTSSTIDYSAASKKIEMVASLMVTNSGGVYTVDFEREGLYYNTLINSSFLTSYYKDFLKDNSIESRNKLVDEIFDYADFLKEFFADSDQNTVLGDTVIVHLQTCYPTYNYKTINGMRIYDNESVTSGTNYLDYLNMTDYIKGVIGGEIEKYIKEEYREGLKAFAITAFTFLIGDNSAGFNLQSDEMYFPTGNCRQVACDPNLGCTYASRGHEYGTAFTGMNRFGTSDGVHDPLSASQNELLDSILSEVFGEIMVKKGVTSTSFGGSSDAARASYRADCSWDGCLSQNESMSLALQGMSYLEILDHYYDSSTFDIINIKEDLYVEGVEFTDAQYNGNVIFYDQNDYKQNFCGRKDGTISSSGCGVTAAAIVASTLMQSSQYDPIYMMKLAQKGGYCGYGISGTSAWFFKSFSKEFGFSYEEVYKNDRAGAKAIEALKTGKSMIIAHMGNGTFTNNGHYIVLSAVNSEGLVYVHDPNNRRNTKNRGSGNGWYDIQTIIKELKGSLHIITKG